MPKKPQPDDEQKTERFNMFMSPSEMKAIEEWAWENRIRSKSEAVRRLCQIGLAADQHLQGAIDIAVKAVDRHMTALPSGQQEVPPHDGDALFAWAMDYQSKLIVDQLDVHEQLTELLHMLDMVAKPIAALKGNADFEDAQLEALVAKAKAMSDALTDKVEFYELRKKAGLLPQEPVEKGKTE